MRSRCLAKALGGIDSALLQAVEANRKALEQFVSGGASLTEKPLKEALAGVATATAPLNAALSSLGDAFA